MHTGIGSSHWIWMRLTMRYNENRCLLSLWKGSTVQAKCICMLRSKAGKSGSYTIFYMSVDSNFFDKWKHNMDKLQLIWIQPRSIHYEIQVKMGSYTDGINDLVHSLEYESCCEMEAKCLHRLTRLGWKQPFTHCVHHLPLSPQFITQLDHESEETQAEGNVLLLFFFFFEQKKTLHVS